MQMPGPSEGEGRDALEVGFARKVRSSIHPLKTNLRSNLSQRFGWSYFLPESCELHLGLTSGTRVAATELTELTATEQLQIHIRSHDVCREARMSSEEHPQT